MSPWLPQDQAPPSALPDTLSPRLHVNRSEGGGSSEWTLSLSEDELNLRICEGARKEVWGTKKGLGGDPSCTFLTCRALGVALALSLLFILLLRLVAAPLVLLLIVGVLAVLAYGIYHCWQQYRVFRDRGASITQVGFTTNFSAYQSVKETWLAACESPCPAPLSPGHQGLGDPGPGLRLPPAVSVQ